MTKLLQNPVLVREMRQAARLSRTPVILSIVTVIAGLLVCAIGGAASTEAPPAEVGSILYQAFFSLAFAVVSWIGPGVAALTIVGERAGRTWEPLVLTGLSPRAVAQGKLLAALSYLGLYLAALAPVAALPFLFGGVTATEVVLGYALLAVFSVVAAGFGLAVSSGAATPAMALLVTLPLAVSASMLTYFGLGVGGSMLAHEVWATVPQGMPVWLPTAYARADLNTAYTVYLVALPVGVAWILVSFFREVTIANLSDPNDDRSSGLKRWFCMASALVVVIGALPPWLSRSHAWAIAMIAQGAQALLSAFTLLVLCAEPAGPSRRILAEWRLAKAGPLRRFFGPGLARTLALLVAVTALAELALAVVGAAANTTGSGASRERIGNALFAGYATSFFGFLAGFALFARSFPRGRLPPRAMLSLAMFAAVAGPLFVLAIAGLITSFGGNAYWIAAPSPLYVFALLDDIGVAAKHPALAAGVAAMVGWTILGAVLGAMGFRRLRTIARAARAAEGALEARLRAEDEAAARTSPATTDGVLG
ncbi:MAG TPA: ABC transporter permease [Polyangiaceae bacterium]|nr:ABC transporter permease [Polyangiaceae bacterium]